MDIAAKELRRLVDKIRAGAVLFFHLFHGTNSSAKIGELGEFVLDFLKPLMPFAVSELLLCVISAPKPISVVQLLKLRDLGAEIPNLFPKHCEMIHAIKNSSFATIENGVPRPQAEQNTSS